jgi:DNA-binding NarL/FixJ family response regulator
MERAVALLTGSEALADGAETPADDPRLAKLTKRQRDVLGLVGHGQSNRQIAHRLSLTEGTIKLHVAAILKALGVHNRTQAAAIALQAGLGASASAAEWGDGAS